ncbi:MAG TPA: hypothetical protein VE912_23780 [Bacteroidales bacterium]|nr:hypothetical protein [Bacteroidales bacterium]
MKNWSFSLVIASIIIILAVLVTHRTDFSNFFTSLSLMQILITFLKSLVVVAVLSIAASITIPALILDLILLLFTHYDFPVIRFLWGLAWGDIAISWYWLPSDGNALFVSAIILGIIGWYAK